MSVGFFLVIGSLIIGMYYSIYRDSTIIDTVVELKDGTLYRAVSAQSYDTGMTWITFPDREDIIIPTSSIKIIKSLN